MPGQYCSENLRMLLVRRRPLYGHSNAVMLLKAAIVDGNAPSVRMIVTQTHFFWYLSGR
jgi:hypothetical protein